MTSGDENHEDDVDMVEAILRLMVVGGLLVAVVLAAGCATARDEKAVTKEQTTLRVPQVTVETPVGPITVKPVEIQQQRTSVTDTHADATIAPQIPPAIADASGSLLPLVPGVGGLLAAAWAFMGKQRATSCLRSTVEGIARAKESMTPEQVEHLHGHLSRSMDASHKQLIRKLKR